MSGAKKTLIVPIERLHELFIPDYEAGLLRWRVSRGSRARAGAVAGTLGYDSKQRERRRQVVKVDGRRYYNARLIWTMFNDRWPPEGMMIDHKNGNTLDDGIWNLRLATRTENQRNRRGANRSSSSEHRGVYYHKGRGRWASHIKKKHLGYYDTEEEASAVAEAARLEHFGEFAGSALKVAK